jgi:hypothetical protein
MSDFLGMQRAVLRSTRPTTEKIVLLAIIDHWSEASPEPWPSVPTLASLSSLGRTAVLDALAALERDGVIAVRRVAGRPNRYDLSRVTVALAATPEPVRQADQSTSPPSGDVAKTAAPVRDADRSGPQTSPSAGRDQSVWRTGPVRLADPKDPKKQPKKEATAVRAHEAEVPAAALALPIAERAKLALENAREAQRLRPQQWAEARKVAEAYGRAVGSVRPLSEMARDSGLRAILVLLAAGFSVPDLEWAANNVRAQAWWRGGDRVRGLASLSVEVVSRALAERNAPSRAISPARSPRASGEDRRIHRNTLLENAEAGRYGAEIRRAARSGVHLRELADELERREAAGDLQLSLPGVARAYPNRASVRGPVPAEAGRRNL